MIRVLVVDDEPFARQELISQLAGEKDIQILGQAANAIEALQGINERKPDVVFLDIQMPKVSGMELIGLLAEPLPRIVFVTAFDDYAIQAFEEQAFDYLLKPVAPDRLAKTLARLRQSLAPQPVRQLAAPPTRLPVFVHNRVKLLPLEEIDFAYSDLGGVHLVSGSDHYHTQLTLKALEEQTSLIRCHRQYLVAPQALAELRLLEHQLAEILTPAGQTVPVSRRFLPDIKARLGLS